MKLQDITEEAIAWLKVPSVHLFKNWHNYAKIARLIGRENFQPWQEGEWGESDKTDFDHESGYRLRQDYQKPETIKVEIPAGYTAEEVALWNWPEKYEWVEPQKCPTCTKNLLQIANLKARIKELESMRMKVTAEGDNKVTICIVQKEEPEEDPDELDFHEA